MTENDKNTFFDEVKKSLELARDAMQEGLTEAEKEISRFFEAWTQEDVSPDVMEEVEEPEVDEAAEETEPVEEDASGHECFGEHFDEVVEEAKSILENAREEVGEHWEELEEKIKEVITSTFESLGISSGDEIEDLKTRISDLEKELSKTRKAGSASSDVEVRSVGGGWYEIVVDGEVVDKVQGKEKARKAAGIR